MRLSSFLSITWAVTARAGLIKDPIAKLEPNPLHFADQFSTRVDISGIAPPFRDLNEFSTRAPVESLLRQEGVVSNRALRRSSDARGTLSTGNGGYMSNVLHQHNIHRSNHSAPKLSWDNRLAAIAKEVSESCVYGHQLLVSLSYQSCSHSRD